MTAALKTFVQCHGTEAGETWEVSLTDGESCVAFVTGLVSNAKAHDAAEYLRFGFASEWQVIPQVDADMQAAGVEALKAERNDDDSNDVETVGAVWHAMIAAWCRKMRSAAGLDEQG